MSVTCFTWLSIATEDYTMKLRYQVTIRTYGAISTPFRHCLGWVDNPPVNAPPREALTSPRATPYLVDPELCPSCGERMKILAALTSPHQDEVIEKILRYVGLWAPPWKRERKARGPPRRRHGARDPPDEDPPEEGDLSPAGPIDPPWEDEV